MFIHGNVLFIDWTIQFQSLSTCDHVPISAVKKHCIYLVLSFLFVAMPFIAFHKKVFNSKPVKNCDTKYIN